jgi:hypothetical protein
MACINPASSLHPSFFALPSGMTSTWGIHTFIPREADSVLRATVHGCFAPDEVHRHSSLNAPSIHPTCDTFGVLTSTMALSCRFVSSSLVAPLAASHSPSSGALDGRRMASEQPR